MSYVTRHARTGIAIAVLVALAWVGGCSDGLGGPGSINHEAEGLIVSDPVLTAGVAAGTMAASAQASGGEYEVTYVSLPPGTVSTGRTATIRRLGDAGSIVTTMFDGGFDPVPIGAQAGDSIDVVVTDATHAIVLQARLVVAARRPPIVVRTNPPHKKTDVPLNSAIVVVFSEPIDASTLDGSSLHLRQGATSVAGRLEFQDAEHLRATFVPDGPLAASTDYQLVVTQAIRDLDGEPLEALVSVAFTTAPPGGLATQLEFTIAPSNTPASVPIRRAIEVTARDAGGKTASRFNGTVTVAIGANPGGGSLSGTTTVTAVAGIATFPDLRVDQPGAGYTLTATANGLVPDTSTAFDVIRVSPGRIAFGNGFVAYPEGIVVMNSDGTGARTHPCRDGHAAWSPDGTRIAVAGQFTGPSTGGICVVNVDGSGRTMLAIPGYSVWADWSPDGAKIAFDMSVDVDTTYAIAIHVMNADGSGSTRLADGSDPAWSPDGTKIAFLRGDIYVMNADGSGVTRLTNTQGFAYYGLAWSPDGTKLAFSGAPVSDIIPYYPWEIHVMNHDGTGLKALTSLADASSTTWSPDGRQLAFHNSVTTAGSDYGLHIFIMNADGSGVTQLTHGPQGQNFAPAWGPVLRPGTASALGSP